MEKLFPCIFHDLAALEQRYGADLMNLKVITTICTKQEPRTGARRLHVYKTASSKQVESPAVDHPSLLLHTDRTFLLAFTSASAAQRQVARKNCRV